jgi:hypothetical protein
MVSRPGSRLPASAASLDLVASAISSVRISYLDAAASADAAESK